MIKRDIENQITSLLQRFPAVAILGPRQVGKTTLAKEIAKKWNKPSVYLDLEKPSDQAKLRDPELYFEQQGDNLLIIDEIQRLPQLFQVLRGIIDERRAAGKMHGQFLLLGSASLDLAQGSSESLAGRIAYVDLGILTASEVMPAGDLNRLWLRGGFPQSYLAATDEESFEWREYFITSYLERDIPALGPRVPAETLRRFWMMLAHNQGQTVNAANLAANLSVSAPTIHRYVDLLSDLLLVRTLRPWSGNVGKRLVKSPKIYLRDSGLTHSLLSIATSDDLLGHPVVGSSWEGFVIENLLSTIPQRANPFFYRTNKGAEIDLLLEMPSQKKIAIEIKRSLSPTLSKGFHFGCESVGVDQRFVVYPGKERYPISKDIEAIPLLDMVHELQNEKK